ncbi:MAG TPA: site-2 protease family protein [Patescibacteria group bacterium]|nr:site-2 protease family protein [Patescibacteria group bacterium]
MLISYLFQNPLIFIFVSVALILSISIHEFAHAYSATKLGDPTAKAMGRVTLNPLAHLDPLGTALLLTAGFGWGKPVLFNPYYLKNPKRDAAVISFAGPFSNFLLAIVFAVLINLLTPNGALGGFLYLVVYYNLVLGFFNLIPLHPLDGFKVVNGFLPESLSIQWMQMAPYGIFVLLLLILSNTTGRLLGSFIDFALKLLSLT